MPKIPIMNKPSANRNKKNTYISTQLKYVIIILIIAMIRFERILWDYEPHGLTITLHCKRRKFYYFIGDRQNWTVITWVQIKYSTIKLYPHEKYNKRTSPLKSMYTQTNIISKSKGIGIINLILKLKKNIYLYIFIGSGQGDLNSQTFGPKPNTSPIKLCPELISIFFKQIIIKQYFFLIN